MVPWSDRAKASSTHRASTFLRSESRRIDETASAASSALVSSESSPPTPKRSLPVSPRIGGEGVVFCAEGLQIKIGRTFKGGSVALLEEPSLLQQRMSDAAHSPPRTPRPRKATHAPSPELRRAIPAPWQEMAEPMFPALGSYLEPGGCSQGEPDPYSLRFSFSSPTTRHGPKVLPELAS